MNYIFIRYVLIGFINTIFYWFAFWLWVIFFPNSPITGNIFAYSISSFWSYCLNTYWSFKIPFDLNILIKFFCVAVVGIIISFTVAWCISLTGSSYRVTMLLTPVILLPVNFALNYFWTFRK